MGERDTNDGPTQSGISAPVRPFSNGMSRMLWMDGNCDRCVKAIGPDAFAEGKPYRCAIQSALDASMLTGELPDRIAKRAGFDQPRDFDGYFPCPEFTDQRPPRARTVRPLDGQEAMTV